MRVRQTERSRSAEEFFRRLFEHVEPRDEPDMKSMLDHDDIHEFIRRNYKMPMIRQLLLKAGVPVKATGLLGRLVGSPRKE